MVDRETGYHQIRNQADHDKAKKVDMIRERGVYVWRKVQAHPYGSSQTSGGCTRGERRSEQSGGGEYIKAVGYVYI
jgi:hypothetical protein